MSKIVIVLFMVSFLAACVVVHEKGIPPGQVKRIAAPGQMKKF